MSRDIIGGDDVRIEQPVTDIRITPGRKLVAAEKTELRTWLEANIGKAVWTAYYREGIKDGDGKPVYGECTRFDRWTGEPVLDDEGNPVTYWGRTFNLRSHEYYDDQEVIRRTFLKAQKLEIRISEEEIDEFVRENKADVRGWAGTAIAGSSPLSRAEIDAEDPDRVIKGRPIDGKPIDATPIGRVP